MQNRFFRLPTTARKTLVLVAILLLSTFGITGAQDLGKAKEVIIDEPADKIEDVFDTDDDVEFEEDDLDVDDLEDQDDVEYDIEKLDEDGDDILIERRKEIIIREKPAVVVPRSSTCREALTSASSADTGLVVTMRQLRDNPEDYYGKTVTVIGEMHRTFSDNVFTIEDDGFFKDHDILVISTSPKEEVVVPLEDSIEHGKDVRVTGVVQPYDRGKLECAFGPLNLESREGHSFTHGPVIVIDTKKTAMLEPPPLDQPMAALPPPEPLPEPAPALEPTEEIAVLELPAELPRTSSGLPILGLAGLLGLSAALAARRYALKGRDE